MTLEERNEGYIPPVFDQRGGRLGETPILWQLRMAYPWRDDIEEEHWDWDQCCTSHVFAVTEREAREQVWDKFKFPGAVQPEAIASCYPVRFRNAKDDEIDAYWNRRTPQ